MCCALSFYLFLLLFLCAAVQRPVHVGEPRAQPQADLQAKACAASCCLLCKRQHIVWCLYVLQFSFQYIAEDPKSSLKLTFRRRTDVMPPPPKVQLFGFLTCADLLACQCGWEGLNAAEMNHHSVLSANVAAQGWVPPVGYLSQQTGASQRLDRLSAASCAAFVPSHHRCIRKSQRAPCLQLFLVCSCRSPSNTPAV